MEDLFDFSNTDNILGTPKNVPTPQAGFASKTNINDDNTTNDDNKETKEKKDKKKESYKIVLVGDPQVGKTTFLTKHLNGSFDSQYRATVGASTFHLQFNTNLDNHKFECMDVAGQDIFAGKRDDYYKNIRGAIIMYDVMNWSSYDNITDIWLRELKDKAPSGIPICVVGNKMENRDTRKVSVEVVAEAISNTFEPKGIGYCEISVKTNQNLAEPFLFLTKQILKIHDSKAIYFVSKISELNLIESMLQHKNNKNNNDKEQKQPQTKDNKDKSQNLDNLFLNNSNTNNNGNINTTTKGGDYLDDIIFKIGDNDNNKNKKLNIKRNDNNNNNNNNMELKVEQNDDNFLANMMNEPLSKSKSHEPKIIPPPKTTTITTKSPKGKSQSISPKNNNQSIQKQSQSQSQRNRSSSSSTNNNNKNQHNKNQNNKNKKQQTRNKPQLRAAANNLNSGNSNDVMIDILLGIQETLNNLTSDVRRLQNDVSYLKQEFKTSKSQRR